MANFFPEGLSLAFVVFVIYMYTLGTKNFKMHFNETYSVLH